VLRNTGNSRQEAQLVVPVPDGAGVSSLAFEGPAKEPTAEILPRDEARRIYDKIVARIKDPALLEFVGYNAVRTSVFPVEAGKTQRVRLVYEHLLVADGNRVDFELPRGENQESDVPWRLKLKLKSAVPIATVYSPTHDIAIVRTGPGEITVGLEQDCAMQPGPFRMSYLLKQDGVTASLLAYPDPETGGGYFLLLAGLPPDLAREQTIKREVTLVFDRSGSMNGEKLRQVREAAFQIIAGLDYGEAFNIIAYNEVVELFSECPVVKTDESVESARRYLNSIHARGGTNIHDALLEALRQKPADDMLPIVLFLTDGIPTIGQTSEKEIRNMVEKGNRYGRRVFTFGVGVDVNAPLLDRVASVTRAVSSYVLPAEDVEVKVAGVFKRLSGPVLAETNLRICDSKGDPAMGRVHDLLPTPLPDLFDGDQLVVLGRYVGEEPLHVELSGNYLNRKRNFSFTFNLDKATTRNSFVPRLWAARKIAALIDAVRQLGAESDFASASRPEVKELTDEIVRLSIEFGILTEYTAFLAREGTDLSREDEVMEEVARNLRTRAMGSRSGLAAVNQSFNNNAQLRQKVLNRHNTFWDRNMQRVQVSAVRQVNDRAFYRQGNRWVDSRVVQRQAEAPDRIVEIGSPEFLALARRLSDRNRQGALSFKGEIMLEVDGRTVLCR